MPRTKPPPLSGALDDDEPRALNPRGWPRPQGYANGMIARGQVLVTGGVVGWDLIGRFPAGFVAQARQALSNILAILAEGEAGPEHMVRLTGYVVDMDEYRGCRRELGRVYRELMGAHYPAMALVEVKRLVEPEARLEIEATAVVG